MQLRYPLETSPSGGLVLALDEPDKVRGALRTSLDTLRGERVYRPDFGREVEPFEVLSKGEALADARRAITRGLEGRTADRVQLGAVATDGGALAIRVYYQVQQQDQDVLEV